MIAHLVVALGWITIAPVIAALGYFGLLLIAWVTDGGAGGWLALPAGMVLAVVAATTVIFGVLMPSVLIGAKICAGRGRGRAGCLSELPVVLLTSLALWVLWAQWVGQTGMATGVVLWSVALIPQTVYWLAVRSVTLVGTGVSAVTAWLRWRWLLVRIPALSTRS